MNNAVPPAPDVQIGNAPRQPGSVGRMHLPDSGLGVWIAHLSASEALNMWEALLSQEERERAGRFRFEWDRRRYICGRGLLRELLGSYLGRDGRSLQFVYSPQGKPALAPNAAERQLCFSISHSGTILLLAFAWNRRVGVDVEEVKWDIDATGIAARFFSSAEQQALRSLDEASLVPAFFRCWTRKEAYVKATGQGLALSLSQFDVSFLAGQPAALLATRPDLEEASRWTLRDLDAGPGYAAAVAVAREAG